VNYMSLNSEKGKIIVLDYGTTSLKAFLYDHDFSIVKMCSSEFHYKYPSNGFIEYEPEQYIEKAVQLITEIVQKTGSGGDIAAISITGQAETIIPIDSEGSALGEAIVWIDTRATKENAILREKIGSEKLYKRTGIPDFDPVMPISKLLWIKENQPERFKKTYKFLMLHDYIIFRLAGRFIGEYSIYSCSGYFDITKKCIDEELLSYAGVSIEQIPEPRPSTEIAGRLLRSIAELTGISSCPVVINGMLDQCASAIGAGNIGEGKLCETTGTVLAISATLPRFSPDQYREFPMLVVCHGFEGRYLALQVCQTAGMLLKWFKDNFYQDIIQKLGKTTESIYTYIDNEIAAKQNKDSSLIVLPHFAGYSSPIVNPKATGVMYGFSLDTDRIDVAKAIMEGVTFLLNENLEMLQRRGISNQTVVSLGGGSKSSLWLQMKADITGSKIVTLENEESTSLGCAFGAALVIGMLNNENEIHKYITQKKIYLPENNSSQKYKEKYQKYLWLNRQLGFTGK
jgi:xylulokinase